MLGTSSWVCASSFASPEANNKSQEIGAKVTKLVPFLGHWRVHIPSGDLEMAVQIMSPSQVRQFIMYYERITKQMLVDLSEKAYAVLYLDKKHRLNRLKFN